MKETSSTGIQLIRNVIRVLMFFQCQCSFERLKEEVFHRYQQEITLEMCREKWRDYLDVNFVFVVKRKKKKNQLFVIQR